MFRNSIYNRMTNAEKEVADVLKKYGIRWSYEQPVFIWDENGRPRVWAPDFYLVSFGIYIEVCGSDKFEYNYRKKIYNNNGYEVIFLHLYKQSKKWRYHLLAYLRLVTYTRNYKLYEILKKEIIF